MGLIKKFNVWYDNAKEPKRFLIATLIIGPGIVGIWFVGLIAWEYLFLMLLMRVWHICVPYKGAN